MINSNGDTTWDSTEPDEEWDHANDPSPPGYRVPTSAEFQTLLNTTHVTNVITTENGIIGIRFTDIATGNSIFLPSATYRSHSDGSLQSDLFTTGAYWSSTQRNAYNVWYLHFYGGYEGVATTNRRNGHSIRPVAE